MVRELMMQYSRDDSESASDWNAFSYMMDGNIVYGVKYAIEFDLEHGLDQDIESVY